MHTFVRGETVFNYNADLSGKVRIKVSDGEILVPGEDLLEFIAQYVRSQKIALIEKQSGREVLGLEVPFRFPHESDGGLDAGKIPPTWMRLEGENLVSVGGESIDTLGLNSRARNCLLEQGIDTIKRLIECRSIQLLKLKNFGKATLRHINACLAKKDLPKIR
jgi:hypothetical protein